MLHHMMHPFISHGYSSSILGYQARYAENKRQDDHPPMPHHPLGTGRYARKTKAAMAAAAAHDMVNAVGFPEFPGYTGYEDTPMMRRPYDALMPPPMPRNPYEDFDSLSAKGNHSHLGYAFSSYCSAVFALLPPYPLSKIISNTLFCSETEVFSQTKKKHRKYLEQIVSF